MPSFDGGHYFLTVLIPIRTDALVDSDDGTICSPVSAITNALATMPTALQSPATEEIGLQSPFAQCRRTHFARFSILTNVVFNGRNPVNALRVAITGKPNPVFAQPVDQISTPYLLFTADFDAESGEDSEVRSYLDHLWTHMEPQLRAIFTGCIGFDQVRDSRSFQDYILRCRIETTMPFNDYWTGAPPFESLDVKTILVPAAIAGVATLLSLVCWIFGVGSWPWGWLTLASLVALVIGLFYAYGRVMSAGAKPFPAAPGGSLPSVLKALYLQQKFTRFASEAQGLDANELHSRFGRFVAEHKPADTSGPTQPPGVIRV